MSVRARRDRLTLRLAIDHLSHTLAHAAREMGMLKRHGMGERESELGADFGSLVLLRDKRSLLLAVAAAPEDQGRGGNLAVVNAAVMQDLLILLQRSFVATPRLPGRIVREVPKEVLLSDAVTVRASPNSAVEGLN